MGYSIAKQLVALEVVIVVVVVVVDAAVVVVVAMTVATALAISSAINSLATCGEERKQHVRRHR